MIKRLSLFKKAQADSRWDFYSCLILFAVLLCQVSNWPASPLFMDCYYHLCVVRGFCDAQGWVGQAFWENAPFGRPHLYPPLFHILGLFFFKCGVGLMTIARFFDFIIYPFLLSTVWLVVRSVDSKRLAFFSLFLLCSSFPLFVSITSNIPFVLAFVFGLLSFLCLKNSKNISALLLLAFCFYTHSLMPWLFVLAFMVYAFFAKESARSIIFVCLSALVLALPLLYHELIHFHFIRPLRAMEFYYADLNPVLYLLFLAGVVFCFRAKRRTLYFLFTLVMAMAVLLFTHRDRFFSGLGLIPMIVFAAYSLDIFWSFLEKNKQKAWRVIFFVTFGFVFYIATPVISLSPLAKHPVFKIDSSFWQRWGMDRASTVKAETIYYAKLVDKLVSMARLNSSRDDIFFFNYPYAGGMISALSHRATSTAMLAEVSPFYEFDQIAYAGFVFLFKDPQDTYYRMLPALIEGYKLKRIDETEVACLYKHDRGAKREIVKAVVPEKICFLLFFITSVIIIMDVFCPKKIRK